MPLVNDKTVGYQKSNKTDKLSLTLYFKHSRKIEVEISATFSAYRTQVNKEK